MPRPPAAVPEHVLDGRLSSGVGRARDILLSLQHEDGWWCGELEGDTILESEYVLLLAWLGRGLAEPAKLAANYIRERQLDSGGWSIYPGGPLEMSASVKAYFALKITGHDPDAAYMARARRAILEAGGAEKVNSFTRFYLALLGAIGWDKCPAVPPEIVLLPRWMPFNIYEMSAWSRTILVPLSIIWARRPVHPLPPEQGIRELFTGDPANLPATMPPAGNLDEMRKRTWIDWEKLFRRLDRAVKLIDRLRIRPLRRPALKKAARWMFKRFAGSDGLGAIFPPIIWSVIALKCLGCDDESPEVRAALAELEKLSIREGETLRLQPCKSPVWDTALATIALREASVPADHPAIRRSVAWLLSKEVRRPGDWAVRNRGHEPGGWYFEFHNEFYPDVDDTCMVVMALKRALPANVADSLRESDSVSPGETHKPGFSKKPGFLHLPSDGWQARFLLGEWSPHQADRDAQAVLAGRTAAPHSAAAVLDTLRPQIAAIWRGARWILAMQNRDGGWGAFDKDNDRELFTRVPFADHNAMIDPSTADLTARMLEMFADLGLELDHPAAARALRFVLREQEPDGAWYGRWGVNYIYGTWQALTGLARIGVPPSDPRIRRGADWLESVQQSCGGWGESPASYEPAAGASRVGTAHQHPGMRAELVGDAHPTGSPPTASQTAWALMGLMSAGRAGSDPVRRGVEYLLRTQNADGTWDEDQFTGTGFPRVFYLKYHLYRIYFPLTALARYERLIGDGDRSEQGGLRPPT